MKSSTRTAHQVHGSRLHWRSLRDIRCCVCPRQPVLRNRFLLV